MGRGFSDVLDRSDYDVTTDPAALAPERALVFEIIGSLANFANTAKRIGLEWLAEQVTSLEGVDDYLDVSSEDDLDDDEDDPLLEDQESNEERETKEVVGTLYVSMPTLETFQKLRSLWDSFVRGEPYPPKHSDWWQLFSKMHDLRTWGPADRIQPAVRDYIKRSLRDQPASNIKLEFDLWYRDDRKKRGQALRELRRIVDGLGGELLDSGEIDDIRYHAALVSIPPNAARPLIDATGPLAVVDKVMTVRPQSLYDFAPEDPEEVDYRHRDPPQELDSRPSLAALLDGFPVEQHALLRNRIDVVPLDISPSRAPLSRRFHGTAMASLILHGDLKDDSPSITRVLKIVPILQANVTGVETPPEDRLILMLVDRAVRLLKEGTETQDPAGRDVIIINHSVCDESSPFTGATSPWARLIDFLSYKFGLIFVVSAGNIKQGFKIPVYGTIPAFRTADPIARQTAILLALEADKAKRSVLPPAEAVNALTVGASHRDHCVEVLAPPSVDPYPALSMINLGSGLGLGFARAIKPEVIFPGGRLIAHPAIDGVLNIFPREGGAFGQTVAMPDRYGASLSATRRSSGTSNAAALSTRTGLLISEALDNTFDSDDGPWYRKKTAACLLKTLIAHGASWNNIGEHLNEYYSPRDKAGQRRENISRFIGYGEPDVSKILSADQHRVTFLAEGLIRVDRRHEYGIPIPDELSSRTDARRITITLGWLTPIRAQSVNYRAVSLNVVSRDGNSRVWPGVKRIRYQPPLGTSKKGTLIHAVLEGRNAVPFVSDSEFVLNVQASSRLTGLSKIDVPYALAVTFEVASTINADIAQSIRNRVAPRIRV